MSVSGISEDELVTLDGKRYYPVLDKHGNILDRKPPKEQ